MTTILVIAIVLLAITEVMFLFGFLKLQDHIAKLKNDTDFYKNIFEIDQKYFKEMDQHYQVMCEKVDDLKTLHQEFCKISIRMCDEYKAEYDAHEKLLECWKGIETRYSDTYEEFKRCTDVMKKLEDKLTMTTEDENAYSVEEAARILCTNCIYDINQCIHEDCPVWRLGFFTPEERWILDGVEGETPPTEEELRDFYSMKPEES